MRWAKTTNWAEEQLPPLEIPLGTLAETVDGLLGAGGKGHCGLYKTHSNDYQVFLLPPEKLCAVGTTNLLSLDAMTCIYTSYYGRPALDLKWHSHVKKSWVISVRLKTKRDRRLWQQDNDVAFVLFHLQEGKTVMEFLCVADGTDSTPKFAEGNGSHRNCGLQTLLIEFLRKLLETSSSRDTHALETILSTRDPEDTNCVDMSSTAERKCRLVDQKHLYEDYWKTVAESGGYIWVLQLEGRENQSKGRGTLVIDLHESPHNYAAWGGSSVRDITSGAPKGLEKEDDIAMVEEEENLDTGEVAKIFEGGREFMRESMGAAQEEETGNSRDEQDEGEENGEEENTPMEDEDALSVEEGLQGLIKRLYSRLVEKDLEDLADNDFDEIKEVYSMNSLLPESYPITQISEEVDAYIGIKLDIDSGIAHGPTPFAVISVFKAYPNCYIVVNSPDSFKRNTLSTRIHVKTSADYQPAYKDGSCPNKLDMAQYPNFEVGKVCVSNRHIEFTMNLHLLQESLGSMIGDIHIAAWNAALNCARRDYRESFAFRTFVDDDIKEDLTSRLNDSCEFELKKNHEGNQGGGIRPQQIRFKYHTGCLYFLVVWEMLQNMALEGLGLTNRNHRLGAAWLHSSGDKQQEIRKAAKDLFHDTHTVVQAAGFRHDYQPVLLGQIRPQLCHQQEFHRWLNENYQEYMKAAVFNFFVDQVPPGVFTSLDVGVNFFSKRKDLWVLIDGKKAQGIVTKQTMVKTEVARKYYLDLESAAGDVGMENERTVAEVCDLVGEDVRVVRR